jgi:predicted phosphohydrolase
VRIWAIADLHLGFSTGKWMDRFGAHWQDHHRKVEASWRERVEPRDIVLHPGDFSWAMKPEEAERDFAWLAGLPGRKVLIKGNHDYWWPKSGARMEALLPPGTFAMKRKALVIDGIPFIGVRGADFAPPEAVQEAESRKDLEREEKELQLSISHLATLPRSAHPPIALFHYPPFPPGSSESPFTRMIEEAGARICVYGHLHTQADWERAFQGDARGVVYRLVSCDYLNFTPLLIEEVAG